MPSTAAASENAGGSCGHTMLARPRIRHAIAKLLELERLRAASVMARSGQRPTLTEHQQPSNASQLLRCCWMKGRFDADYGGPPIGGTTGSLQAVQRAKRSTSVALPLTARQNTVLSRCIPLRPISGLCWRYSPTAAAQREGPRCREQQLDICLLRDDCQQACPAQATAWLCIQGLISMSC